MRKLFLDWLDGKSVADLPVRLACEADELTDEEAQATVEQVDTHLDPSEEDELLA